MPLGKERLLAVLYSFLTERKLWYDWWKINGSIPWYFLHPLAALILAQPWRSRGKRQRWSCTEIAMSPNKQAFFSHKLWKPGMFYWNRLVFKENRMRVVSNIFFLSPTIGCLHQHPALRLFWRPLNKSILKESARFKVSSISAGLCDLFLPINAIGIARILPLLRILRQWTW